MSLYLIFDRRLRLRKPIIEQKNQEEKRDALTGWFSEIAESCNTRQNRAAYDEYRAACRGVFGVDLKRELPRKVRVNDNQGRLF